MSEAIGQRPALGGVHHVATTVTDIDASIEWYERVLGLQRVPVPIPHHGDEEGGYATLVMDPGTGLTIGLHHHERNDGAPFDESRTGLDHISIAVPVRDDLHTWTTWLDGQGVPHSGVIDADVPFPYSVVVFRDPDNTQLELFWMDMSALGG